MTIAHKDNSWLAKQRLIQQQIAQGTAETPGAIVRNLVAMQAQDYGGALWSIGLRLPAATARQIEQAIAQRMLVRTWPMRGTLHFVAPEDVRWLLALLAGRIIAGNARRHAELGLDEGTLTRSVELFARALEGGQQLTRAAMLAVLEGQGIATDNQRGYHILGWAAQTAKICFGPHAGKQPTFVWLDDWIPVGHQWHREEALAELAKRYFTGHGPATIHDFMWWSGLPATDARVGLALAQDALVAEEVAGRAYWYAPNSLPQQNDTATAYLLPGFDEYLLGYTDRSAVLDPTYNKIIQPGKNGIFMHTVVIDGQVVGSWQRTIKKGSVTIVCHPFTTFSATHKQAVELAAVHYGNFVERVPVMSFQT